MGASAPIPCSASIWALIRSGTAGLGVPRAYLRGIVREAVVALGEDGHGVYSPHTHRPGEDPGVEVSADILAICRSVEVKGELAGTVARSSVYPLKKSSTNGDHLCSPPCLIHAAFTAV